MNLSPERAQAGVNVAIQLAAQHVAATKKPARWSVILGDISLDGVVETDGKVLVEGELSGRVTWVE